VIWVGRGGPELTLTCQEKIWGPPEKKSRAGPSHKTNGNQGPVAGESFRRTRGGGGNSDTKEGPVQLVACGDYADLCAKGGGSLEGENRVIECDVPREEMSVVNLGAL